MPIRRALCWIRRDLRLGDHSALAAATSAADEVAVVFVFDRRILDSLPRNDRRVTFIHHAVSEIDAKLRDFGSQLVVRYGDPLEEIPAVAESFGAEAVFVARDYEPYARARDSRMAEMVPLETVRDSVVIEPHELCTQAGGAFTVYTPFSKAWAKLFQPELHAAEHKSNPERFASAALLEGLCHPWSLAEMGFEAQKLWLEAGEDAALARLSEFRKRLDAYGDTRDFPAQPGVSTLSVDFRFGTISIRAAVREALSSDSAGAKKWLAELVWREFYQHVLWHFPHAVEKPFKAIYADLEYPGEAEHFEAWKWGRTGYPLVDAGMRCLCETGYLHNRLRMVVASFLTKDLLVDYRQGEAVFAEWLLDFDLASNNGGWQWAASTGCDAQPYFRIFNPVMQSRKFDAEGAFIRRWVPELAALSNEAIHAPWEHPFELLEKGIELGRDYPNPIVNHFEQKEKAIALLSRA
jgi:deoxyribodipyrimidine photo-lyase